METSDSDKKKKSHFFNSLFDKVKNADNKKIIRSVTDHYIYVVILCAFAGFICMYSYLHKNIVQHSPKHNSFNLQVEKWVPKKDTAIIEKEIVTFKVQDSLFTAKSPAVSNNNILVDGYIFNRVPVFMIWVMLILISISLSSGAAPVFCYFIYELKEKYSLKTRHVIISIFVAVILIFLIGKSLGNMDRYYSPDEIIDDFQVLFRQGNVLKTIMSSTFFLIIPEIVILFLVAKAAAIIKDDYTGQNYLDPIRKIGHLNKVLNQTLHILAVIIVFSVLESTALRQSIKTVVDVKGFDIFPESASLLFGMFFSFFLAILYMPVQFYLNRKIEQLEENINNKPSKTEDEKSYLAALDAISSKSAILSNFKMVFTILAPFISSFLPGVLNVFGN